VARRCPQESSDVETFRLANPPSARFSVLIPDLGARQCWHVKQRPNHRATLAPHAQYAAMLDMHRFMVAPEASVLKTDGEVKLSMELRQVRPWLRDKKHVYPLF